MIDTLLTALLLGFFAGGIQGPYTTVVAGTALERGFQPALKLAFIPLVTETPAFFLTVVLLRQVDYGVLTGIGLLGGLAIGGLGLRLASRQGKELDGERTDRRDFWHLAVAGLLSPAPWIFWLVAAGPLFLRSWNRGWGEGLVFAVVLYGMFIGTATGIAWAASHGHRVMPDRVRRRILRGVGIFLIVAGGVLVWQAWEGNFQTMVSQQEQLRERVR